MAGFVLLHLPADFAKLSRFIDDLSTVKIQRLVTQNPERWRD